MNNKLDVKILEIFYKVYVFITLISAFLKINLKEIFIIAYSLIIKTLILLNNFYFLKY